MAKDGPTSGPAIIAAFVPTFTAACITLAVFALIRNNFRIFYAPRTFLGTVPEKHRTPVSRASGASWLHDFRTLSDRFVLQHNSLDAFLYLRFLKLIIGLCLAGACITWPILLPISANGGGTERELNKFSFSNIARNDFLWAHLVIAWVLFYGILLVIVWERLKLIGFRQACYVNERYSKKLSSRVVLFMNVPQDALQPDNLQRVFGSDAERSWPVKKTGDLRDLIQQRSAAVDALEGAILDLEIKAVKHQKKTASNGGSYGSSSSQEEQSAIPASKRPTKRRPFLVGDKVDAVEHSRKHLCDVAERVTEYRSRRQRPLPGNSAVFVLFKDQAAAHRAFQEITFMPRIPLQDRYLAVQPKEVLWPTLPRPVPDRISKASLALVFVVAFTTLFSIPVYIIGTFSNVKELADRVHFLHWVNDLPPSILGLLTGFVPPFLTSWFVSYVPKLFRHIAKMSGEPTTPQAELKTQAWYFAFQVIQVFFVTTISSGVAAVATKLAMDPGSTPALLASNLPKSSNFYLTYFILQGTASAASNVLNYSDLLEYLFYEHIWDKTPRQKFSTYAQMKGTPWASWYPKFTNFFVIAIAYSCIAPLTLGFAGLGIYIYYLSYRYSLLYVRQTKIDTRGEAYNRALKQLPTGLYIAQLCLLGLFSARKAAAQATLMIVLIVLTAITNLVADRALRPLELYLGVDKWQAAEVPLLAEEDGIDPSDEAALHAASHGRRLGLRRLPDPLPRRLSDFFDHIISTARTHTRAWLDEDDDNDDDQHSPSSSDLDLDTLYLDPALTSRTPRLWIPRDPAGVAARETAANEAVGLETTDRAAEVDAEGRLHWDHRFENVPVWSAPKVV